LVYCKKKIKHLNLVNYKIKLGQLKSSLPAMALVLPNVKLSDDEAVV
jgi:hypothetical protein